MFIRTESESRPNGVEQTSDARQRPLQSPSQDAAIRWADGLRKVAAEAPLQSLFVAFLLGAWVACRR
jgi:hypothetical protein